MARINHHEFKLRFTNGQCLMPRHPQVYQAAEEDRGTSDSCVAL